MTFNVFSAPLSAGVLLGLFELSSDEIRGVQSSTCSPTVTADEMGLASSTLQRAAPETVGFPSTVKPDEKSRHGEHGADSSSLSNHEQAFPTNLNKAPVEAEMPLDGIACLKGSCGTLDKLETGGKDESGSNEGFDEPALKMSSRHGGLSRSLADRTKSPEFTPFGGPIVREQPALVPVAAETVTPDEPFDADFMMRGSTRAARNDESIQKSRTSTVETPVARKACDTCVRRKTKCDGNVPCARCIKSNEKCNKSALKTRHRAPRGAAPPAVAERGHLLHPGSRDEEVSRIGAMGRLRARAPSCIERKIRRYVCGLTGS